MATRFRKGMNPRALGEYWIRLIHRSTSAFAASSSSIPRRIHDSVQSAFVGAGVNPDDLLKNADARRQIENKMKAALAELPALIHQQPPEYLLRALWELYRFFRCAFPAQWGLTPAAPRRKQTVPAQSASPATTADTAAAPAPGMAADVEQTIAQTLANIQAQLMAIRAENQAQAVQLAAVHADNQAMRAEMGALRQRVDDMAILLAGSGVLWETDDDPHAEGILLGNDMLAKSVWNLDLFCDKIMDLIFLRTFVHNDIN
ncbi:hypothetical protein N7535_000868 [Penicillium sp. DV-2018c]|nr:hypothetical protein N7461_005887 [Penicillium sp. DV-2018c]KAJ5582248.1 hypothetical protein N7535_000868 [Penicillium sp. DV-2018c]